MLTRAHAKKRLALHARAARYRRSINLYARYATKVFGINGAR